MGKNSEAKFLKFFLWGLGLVFFVMLAVVAAGVVFAK